MKYLSLKFIHRGWSKVTCTIAKQHLGVTFWGLGWPLEVTNWGDLLGFPFEVTEEALLRLQAHPPSPTSPMLHWNGSKEDMQNKKRSPELVGGLERICCHQCSERPWSWLSTKPPFCQLFSTNGPVTALKYGKLFRQAGMQAGSSMYQGPQP